MLSYCSFILVCLTKMEPFGKAIGFIMSIYHPPPQGYCIPLLEDMSSDVSHGVYHLV